MYYELYLITNKLNNKKYVGQTISSKGYLKRFEEHCDLAMAGDHSCLHQAMKKYGVTNFSVKLLLHNIDDSQIDFYETLWINKLNTYYGNHKGYNMTFGGRGTKGYVFTEDVRLKMSSGSKNYWKNLPQDEYLKLCKMRSDNMKGKKFSPEHKQKISEWAKTRTGEKKFILWKTSF